MIKYQLGCEAGHRFEAWFSSISGYEAEADAGRVTCPACGSHDIDRVPAAPAIISKTRARTPRPPVGGPMQVTTDGPGAAEYARLAAELRALKQKILQGSENVGSGFAEEARRIHFGETAERAIHGQASIEEARELSSEGVPFGLLPPLPEDHN